ncbi:MAG TPA: hypothetical protein VHC21_03800 [Candidatus Saccharimonadales bacterium]|nr:hypothetical protein [Candidatus Saccharimonadales bacterium]
MEDLQASVYNEPQPDGSVIQYDRAGRIIACFESDEACLDAMGVSESGGLRQVGIEIREAAAEELRPASRNLLSLIGVRTHAA